MRISELMTQVEAPSGQEQLSFWVGTHQRSTQLRKFTTLHDTNCKYAFASEVAAVDVRLDDFADPALFKRSQVCPHCCGVWAHVLRRILQHYGVTLDVAAVEVLDVAMNLEAVNPLGADNWMRWLYQQTVDEAREQAFSAAVDWHGPWVVSFDNPLSEPNTWWHGIGTHVSVRPEHVGQPVYVHSVIPLRLERRRWPVESRVELVQVEADFNETQLRLAVDLYEASLQNWVWSAPDLRAPDGRWALAAKAVETAKLCLV